MLNNALVRSKIKTVCCVTMLFNLLMLLHTIILHVYCTRLRFHCLCLITPDCVS
jgi:hypothetical protein